MPISPKHSQTTDAQLARYGEACFAYLIANPEELSRFMQSAGYTPDGLRAALGRTDFAHGLVDYFAQNESALLAMCGNAGIRPEDFMSFWQRIEHGSI